MSSIDNPLNRETPPIARERIDLYQIVLSRNNPDQITNDQIVIEGVKVIRQQAYVLAGERIVMLDRAGKRVIAVQELNLGVLLHQAIESVDQPDVFRHSSRASKSFGRERVAEDPCWPVPTVNVTIRVLRARVGAKLP